MQENNEEDDMNDREQLQTKHHRHHDVLNAENLKEKLVDIDIGKQMSPRYDLFSSIDFSCSDLSSGQHDFTSNAYWQISPSVPTELPDLD